ncbi:MAG: hypothetical protein LBB38_01415 [Puniceicoccales bacterium]|jgi:hypothetical protein|nr:hypothetical protein [Puniceicoccales bacterium]
MSVKTQLATVLVERLLQSDGGYDILITDVRVLNRNYKIATVDIGGVAYFAVCISVAWLRRLGERGVHKLCEFVASSMDARVDSYISIVLENGEVSDSSFADRVCDAIVADVSGVLEDGQDIELTYEEEEEEEDSAEGDAVIAY